MATEPKFVEPFYVEDKVITGLALADEIAPGVFRCSFYSEQRSLEYGIGGKERTVIAKFILTADAMKALAQALATAGQSAPDEFADIPAASIHQH